MSFGVFIFAGTCVHVAPHSHELPAALLHGLIAAICHHCAYMLRLGLARKEVFGQIRYKFGGTLLAVLQKLYREGGNLAGIHGLLTMQAHILPCLLGSSSACHVHSILVTATEVLRDYIRVSFPGPSFRPRSLALGTSPQTTWC